MNEVTTTVLTILLSAFVGSITSLFVERTMLKYRLRTENEYAILMRLWEKAYWLKSRANCLRPVNDNQDVNAPGEKERRLNLFDEAMEQFKQEMYLHKPFYPHRIHLVLNELRIAADWEAIDFSLKRANPVDGKYWTEAKESAKKINALIDELCGAIRRHVHGREVKLTK